jgi:hypothetical protein
MFFGIGAVSFITSILGVFIGSATSELTLSVLTST